MYKAIRILEVPLYLLVIAMGCLESGSTIIGVILILTSVARLWTNTITDDTIYKR